jgi:outer membrane usher protein
VGTGRQWLLGFERAEGNFSFGVQATGASRHFLQLGQSLDSVPTKQQIAANLSYGTEALGSFGLGLVRMNYFDKAAVTTVSANYSTKVGKDSRLQFTASRALSTAATPASTAVGVTFIMPIESDTGYTNLTASANRQDDSQNYYIAAAHSPSDGNGLGWRVSAGDQSQNTRAEGGLSYTGRYGQVNGDISHANHLNAVRLGATGGMVIADGHFFATRKVDGSFGIAEIAGYPNIGIGLGGGSSLTKTDANGIALIPRLQPYQNNPVRIDINELPMSAELDSVEQMAVPAYRSAVKVVFPVRTGRGAMIKINFSDGQPAPVGAPVYLEGDPQAFYVARSGAAYVTGLATTSQLQLRWKNQTCKFEVTLPPATEEDIARVGPVVCEGVVR